jgi:hypothetical protein
MEPLISEEVQGGWWFPEDMQVDARLLHATLKDACVQSRVTFLEGQDSAVEVGSVQESLDDIHPVRGSVRSGDLTRGRLLSQAVVFDPVRPVVRSLRLRDGRRVEASKVSVVAGCDMSEVRHNDTPEGQHRTQRPSRRSSPPCPRARRWWWRTARG